MKRRSPGRPRRRGAPKGNTNALKTGRHTRAAKRLAKRRNSYLRARLKKAIILVNHINRYLAHEKIALVQGLATNRGELSKNK